MSEQNKAIVQQAYNSFKTGDIEGLLNLMSDDISWTLPSMEGVPFGGKRTGRASVAEFFASVGASQEVVSFEPRELIAEGDKVIALGSYKWRVIANNREFGGDFAHAWTISDAKAVEFQEYMDTAVGVNAHRKAMSA
ncbi:MAG TPA: nuclear transport factor 2 family protein [Pyrinomonadaceae bacterium]|nr:nuclear transport factor 2 family protein [Pyrinomonadaceae bacterium]